MPAIKQLTAVIDFHSMEILIWKSMAVVNCSIARILQVRDRVNSSFSSTEEINIYRFGTT